MQAGKLLSSYTTAVNEKTAIIPHLFITIKTKWNTTQSCSIKNSIIYFLQTTPSKIDIVNLFSVIRIFVLDSLSQERTTLE